MKLTKRTKTVLPVRYIAMFFHSLFFLLVPLWLGAIPSSAAAAGSTVPADGLVAFYDLAGNALDSSVNGNDGTLHGCLATYDRFAQADGALYLNNSLNDSVELPGAVISGTTLSVNLWISTDDKGFGLISGANASRDNEYLLWVDDGGLEIWYHGSAAVSRQSVTDVNDGRWRMVTVVTEPAETRIYLDGQLVQTAVYTLSSPLDILGLWVGQEQDSLNGGFDLAQTMKGRIDDVSIHNRALSQTEITNLYGGYNAGIVIGGVGFPSGITSFADQVVSYSPGPQAIPPYTSPQAAVGAPDYTGTDDGSTYVSLGFAGELIVRFTDNALTASGDPANDLWLFEIGNAIEPSNVSISEDGLNWIDLGLVQGATRGVDLDTFISSGVEPGKKYYYVKVVDSNQQMSTSPWGGADIDAVGAIESTANAHWIRAFPTFMLTPGDQVTLRAESSEKSTFTYLWSVTCPELASNPALSSTSARTVQWTVPALPAGIATATCTTSVAVTNSLSATVTTAYTHQVVTADNRVDSDTDGLYDHQDNCPLVANSDQADSDLDFVGDICDPDDDNDGVADVIDNCPLAANSDQKDTDGNGVGDGCDAVALPFMFMLLDKIDRE